MSIHPSLAFSLKNRKSRSVLSRIEKIKYFQEKGLIKEGSSFFGLPKIKTLKIKIKKEKVEKAAEGAVAGANANKNAPAKPAAKGSAATAAKLTK